MKKKLTKLIASIVCASLASSLISTCTQIPDTSDSSLSSSDFSALVSNSVSNSSTASSSNESASASSEMPSLSESASGSESTSASESASESAPETVEVAEMSIHFPFLGNRKSGDCVLIKTGDTEVLIDAGSDRDSASTVVPYLQKYCTDNVLEYVVVTHGDQDHIAAFVGKANSATDGVFENFKCGTIIDFPQTTKDTNIYKEYVALRDAEVTQGATHYTALECWYEQKSAQRSYTLGEGITMEILYQKYYEEKTSNENNYSVCLMITHNDNHYLFTGDLEESGEKSLMEKNKLPKCKLYKAGHHGSNTSSSTALLSVIQPEIVVATCVAGDTFGFPHQEFINNIAPYTDKLYISSYKTSSAYELLNGNIVVTANAQGVFVNGSNNNTLFKDTNWFKSNRTTPAVWNN